MLLIDLCLYQHAYNYNTVDWEAQQANLGMYNSRQCPKLIVGVIKETRKSLIQISKSLFRRQFSKLSLNTEERNKPSANQKRFVLQYIFWLNHLSYPFFTCIGSSHCTLIKRNSFTNIVIRFQSDHIMGTGIWKKKYSIFTANHYFFSIIINVLDIFTYIKQRETARYTLETSVFRDNSK